MRLSELFLDPLPCLLTIQFDGEGERFVKDGGAIFVEAQMDRVVESIVALVAQKKKAAVLRWVEASGGVRKHYSVRIKGPGET
jgi:hypothetical protein